MPSDPYDPYQPPRPAAPPPSPWQPPASPVPVPGQYAYPPAPTPYAAGYGFEPYTGLPYSDKSKVGAGLLQLLLGFFFALGGVGRLYAGHTGLGMVQVILSVVGWISFWCGFVLLIPFIVFFGLWLWFVVDGIILLASRSLDGQGRPLR